MAKMWITEYSVFGVVDAGSGRGNPTYDTLPVPREPAAAEQTVTFTTATQSSAFGSSTIFVRLVADAACHIVIDENPTAATADSQYLPSGIEYFRAVAPGMKISVYDGSS